MTPFTAPVAAAAQFGDSASPPPPPATKDDPRPAVSETRGRVVEDVPEDPEDDEISLFAEDDGDDLMNFTRVEEEEKVCNLCILTNYFSKCI